MPGLMGDSQLNGAERSLQQPFRKLWFFNGLLMSVAVFAAYVPMRALPNRRPMAPAIVALNCQPVELPPVAGPLTLAGAWQLEAGDPRFGGLSALTIDRGRFLAISDLGAVVRFEFPAAGHSSALLQDLRQGPGPAGEKWARDAESIVRDPRGRGWWIGFEQHHSLWLYDDSFGRELHTVDLPDLGWRDNRGAEGLIVRDGALVVLAENGKDAVSIGQGKPRALKLHADAEVADAAAAPDGSGWVLLREKGSGGISQSIAHLRKTHDGYQADPRWQLPKERFDNYEGMAIERLPDGRWRFWLVTDDGHRFMARTLLVALDLAVPVRTRHDKSPATSAGLLQKPSVEAP
jgi:hypothetical protein